MQAETRMIKMHDEPAQSGNTRGAAYEYSFPFSPTPNLSSWHISSPSYHNGYNGSYSSYLGSSQYRGLSGDICSINMDGAALRR